MIMVHLLAAVIVQEVVEGRRQRLRHEHPRVSELTGSKAHKGRIAMLPPCGRQKLAHCRTGISLVPTAHK